MNENLRVLIVDDEPNARRGIQLLLEKCDQVEIIGEAGSGEAAVRQIREQKPDLVFLDVQMPGMDGFDALAKVPPGDLPAVIFVTAYDQYAVKAFEYHALDYLLKPFDDDRFFAALDRAKQTIRRQRAEALNTRLMELVDSMRDGADGAVAAALAPASVAERSDRVVVKNGGEVIVLKAGEIDWIEADGDYMKFHVGGRSLLQRETMASLESRLDSGQFRRIHRSTIVNLDRVAKLSSAFNGEHLVQLKDGTRLKVSKGYQDGLQDWLRTGQ